jgi:hypothetical protein
MKDVCDPRFYELKQLHYHNSPFNFLKFKYVVNLMTFY